MRSQRFFIHTTRHELFWNELKSILTNDLHLEKPGKKRQRDFKATLQKADGDPQWNWENENVYTYAIVILQHKQETMLGTVNYSIFQEALQRIIDENKWYVSLLSKYTNKENRIQEIYNSLPSFMFCMFSKIANFRENVCMDFFQFSVFSVGRYLYLSQWIQRQNTMDSDENKNSDLPPISRYQEYSEMWNPLQDIHLQSLHPLIARAVTWLCKERDTVAFYTEMVWLSLKNESCWKENLSIDELKRAKVQIAQANSVACYMKHEKVSVGQYAWFLRNLPEMLHRFHGKGNCKDFIDETDVTVFSFEAARKLLVEESNWPLVVSITMLKENGKENVQGVRFDDPSITVDQVYMTMLHICQKWGKVFGMRPAQDSKFSKSFQTLRAAKYVWLFAPASWIETIQQRLIPFLCTHSKFRRRFSVPVCPLLTHKFMKGSLEDVEMVIRSLYRLIHLSSTDSWHSYLASRTDDCFSVYHQLPNILAHFQTEKRLQDEFFSVFIDSELLYFSNNKEQLITSKPEMLLGIKNKCGCLQNALRSFCEIKAQHYITNRGIEILHSMETAIHDFILPNKAGPISLEQAIGIYMLCGSSPLKHEQAIDLFLDVRVNGQLFFSAELSGSANWNLNNAYMQRYEELLLLSENNNKSIPNMGTSSTVDAHKTLQTHMLYHTCRILEEMAHRPVRITREEYQSYSSNKTSNFRGKPKAPSIKYDPLDFILWENTRYPVMMKDEGMSKKPQMWFLGDIFPICPSKFHHEVSVYPNYIWEDLRPFEDAEPGFLEFILSAQ